MEVDHRHLARLVFAVEHAVQGKITAYGQAVASPDQFVFPPGFDAVGDAHLMKGKVGLDDRLYEPRALSVGASPHHAFEVLVEAERKMSFGDVRLETFRDVEVVDGNQTTRIGVFP